MPSTCSSTSSGVEVLVGHSHCFNQGVNLVLSYFIWFFGLDRLLTEEKITLNDSQRVILQAYQR